MWKLLKNMNRREEEADHNSFFFMFEELKQEVWEANQMLPAAGLVMLTWGNVSCIDRKAGVVAIKPSGMEYGLMTPEDIVVCDLNGHIVDGCRNPSSDLHTHLVLYRTWPEIGAIVHTHSTYATLQAQISRDLKPYGTTHADTFHGPVPCTRDLRDEEIQEGYETQTGSVIAETFEQRNIDPMEVPGVLVSRHGPFTWGVSPKQAVEHAMILEQCARMGVLDSLMVPGLQEVTTALLDEHYHRKHGPGATYGQP